MADLNRFVSQQAIPRQNLGNSDSFDIAQDEKRYALLHVVPLISQLSDMADPFAVQLVPCAGVE